MNAPWLWLLAAGLVEVVFSQSIKPTDGFTRLSPTLICLILGGSSVYLLTRAMQGISVGTAYAVFTGIGATGAVALGVTIGRDPVSVLRLVGVALIVVGVIVCRIAEPGS